MPEVPLNEIPRKPQYKLSEVCQFTDTQPYVLRFWESEFPQLSPERSRSGQPVYRREDIELVCRIKQLLNDGEHTLAGVRQMLEQEMGIGGAPADAMPSVEVVAPATPEPPTAVPLAEPDEALEMDEAPRQPELPGTRPAARPGGDGAVTQTVPRARYEDAIDEIETLRLRVKDAENNLRRAELSQRAAEERSERDRLRLVQATSRIERLIDTLS